jgi:glucose-1-phosphate cytidylyltransferase
MKVVFFCGGLGTRLKAFSDTTPKPMVNVGDRPILWHLMRYYAHFGHSEFILCLGHGGDAIRSYFSRTNGFGTADARAEHSAGRDADPRHWRITCVDTGATATIGERLQAVQSYVAGDEIFLANYSDGLSDVDLNAYVEYFRKESKTAAFVCVRPNHSFHVVELAGDGCVRDVRSAAASGVRINGGFFAFRQAIFDHLRPGEDLVDDAFPRLIALHELIAFRHEGFWHCMDTFKDKLAFDDMAARGHCPWALWNGLRGTEDGESSE